MEMASCTSEGSEPLTLVSSNVRPLFILNFGVRGFRGTTELSPPSCAACAMARPMEIMVLAIFQYISVSRLVITCLLSQSVSQDLRRFLH